MTSIIKGLQGADSQFKMPLQALPRLQRVFERLHNKSRFFILSIWSAMDINNPKVMLFYAGIFFFFYYMGHHHAVA